MESGHEGAGNVVNAFKAKILAVDDEVRLLDLHRELLTRAGYEVYTAASGNDALKLVKQISFDVMLLDLRLPDVSGHQVMRFIKSHNIDITVVVISGENSVDAVAKVLRLGAYDYLRKPYMPEELLNTISNALEKCSLEQENKAFQARLQDSDKLHRYIVNSSPDIVYMLDQEGRFTFLNDRIEKLLGYKKAELIGQHYSVVVFPDDLQLARFVFNERRTGPRSSRNVELRLKHKDNQGACYFESNALSIELTAMGVYSRSGGDGKQKFIGTYGSARDITERKKAEEMIHFQAYHDLLTGLPNRVLFKDRLGLAITHVKRNNQMLAVMFLDLDRFKVINDTLGHAMGDRLLQAVSQRLQGCLRAEDTLSRFGGDEFTLLLSHINCRDDVVVIAEKILAELNKSFVLDNNELFVGASIGIALFPEAGSGLDTLIKNADAAMYSVKSRSKNGYQFYSKEMDKYCHSRLMMERDLRRALEQNQFRVYFQPQVNVSRDEVVGVEALIRWEHPTKGLIYPNDFIPLAEETGLIVDIGRWVLDAACGEIKKLNASTNRKIRLSVNFSPLQVEQPDFVNMVIDILHRHQLPGESLEMEITENIIMKDMEKVVNKLRDLSRYGIKIAIDDFGTGYSSLSYLQQFPIHTIKIDRSFVNEMNTGSEGRCIVNAIIYMAKGLGLNLIAEGVETKPQLDYLKQLGCTEVQGFIFGKAEPLDHIVSVLSQDLQVRAVANCEASAGPA
ncbi:MAG: EAL domain-containing protein [Gammaproteobacteria bacterium]|nr:EAL domain-containing protein [Gammaproteobacteria bacterium]